MATKRAGLGRGLGALIRELPVKESITVEEKQPASGVAKIPIGQIHQGRWQPRHEFTPESLAELVTSVRTHGVLQPLLLRKTEQGYELIAGERRWRAAREAGLQEVPALVITATDKNSLELALVENLQRENLNILEEAEGYRDLCDKFQMTQEQVSERVGKARVTITNAMRILQLPESVRELIARGLLSTGHAKALLSLEIEEEQELIAKQAVTKGLSVRELEKLVASRLNPPKSRAISQSLPDVHLRELTDRLREHFGTGVKLTPCSTLPNGKKAKGKIEIDYYSNDDLDRLLSLLGFTPDLL